MKNLDQFIQKIPKAEMHLHIEGTLEPELMFAIARRNKAKLRFKNVREVRKAYAFHNLQSFLDIYYKGANVLLHEEDFFDMTWAYFKKAASQNVRHAEIFFDPQTHTERGVSFKTAITGVHRACEKAKRDLNVSSKLILCFLRHLSEKSAVKTLKEALPFRDWITAVGLDSSEAGNPPVKFKKVFEMARKEGFRAVAHAGEEGPPEYIWQALDVLKVSRVDHGVRCVEDKKLMERLVKEEIPLTVCPLSNIKLCVFKRLEDHNLKTLLESGIRATVNSDDPAYFGGYVAENLAAAQKGLGLAPKDIVALEKNAFEAAFLNPKEKKCLLDDLDLFVKNQT